MNYFAVGQTIVKRDLYRGRVWNAWPKRVISDNDSTLTVVFWPGTEGLVPSSWIRALDANDSSIHHRMIDDLVQGNWRLEPWVWENTVVVSVLRPACYFSIDSYFNENGSFLYWYINFQIPFERREAGIDTFDLLLDLTVNSDFTYAWKDEAEYNKARELGIISDHDHAEVQNARRQVISLLAGRRGPFTDVPHDWRPSVTWRQPILLDTI